MAAKCPKCKSEAIGWVSDPSYDESDGTYIRGYYRCAVCGKLFFDNVELPKEAQID